MDYPFFVLQSPITELQARIDRFIYRILSESYPGTATRRLFGVPVSQLVRIPERSNGRDYGKIAVLLVDAQDYSPLCAVLIASWTETRIVRDAELIMDDACLPWVTVTAADMEKNVRQLLRRAIGEHHKPIIKNPVNFTELHLGSMIRTWFIQLTDYYRVIEQVGLSEVVETLNLDDREQLRKEYRGHRPQSVPEFLNLDQKHQYWLLSEFAASSSLDLLVLQRISNNKTPDDEKAEWWPALAIEIDGPYHTKGEQPFRDFKKNRICLEALLPLLRVSLVDAGRDLVKQADAEKNDDSETIRVDIDFVRYMILVGLSEGTLHNQQQKQAERRRLVAAGRRVSVLIQQGLLKEEAIHKALDEMNSSDEAVLALANEMGGACAEEQIQQDQNKDLESEYHAMYGKAPRLEIDVDSKSTLRGRLGNIEIPPLRAFCNSLDSQEMEFHLRAFAKDWLFHCALYGVK